MRILEPIFKGIPLNIDISRLPRQTGHAPCNRYRTSPPLRMKTETPTPHPEQPAAVNLRAKYVRLIERRPDGQVSFEFSIGWPELSVELMLPAAAFDEFCVRHEVNWRDEPFLATTTNGDQPQ